MTLPTATYRLQFRDGMDFDRAAGLAPYWAGLGISHLYASPLFTATGGSTHGYDITDPTEIDPALGGRAGLERLSAALKAEGLGLVLDIVPNHMAFAPETPWLRDVLRHGRESRYAGHFDMDIAADRLRLPWLPAPFHALAADGAFRVEDDADGPVLVTGGLRIPLAETPSLAAARNDPGAITALHEEQPWRAVYWRTEMDSLSHRRFFNVTGLIGVKVEDPAVFEDVHRLLFELTEAGIVDGIRVDHVDGLADPAGYLDKLRARVPDHPVWVEKILTGDERLPSWPVEGTTGYEITRVFDRVLAAPEGLDHITQAFRAATGRTAPFHDVLADAKRQVLTQDLSAELWALHRLFCAVLDGTPEGEELGPEATRQAIVEYITAFPRYRTYLTADAQPEEDLRLIADTIDGIRPPLPVGDALKALGAALTARGPAADALRVRMQQVTGAVAAKAQEDTAFYRETRLLSMNEVGGEPDDGALDTASFHALMTQRAEEMPHGMVLTSSHDTKRSEDARTMLIAATHAPAAFDAWMARCAAQAPEGLDPGTEWYLSQSRLALGPEAEAAAERLADHAVKALREAKEATYHTAPDAAVEDRATGFARALAETEEGLAALAEIAAQLSLVQVALKLTIPGIPDIYQGAEIITRTLTDPDNRRPVDFDLLRRALEAPDALPQGPARDKFALTRTLLRLRRDRPALFLEGSYAPAEAAPGQLSFTRQHEGLTLLVTVALRPGAAAEGAAEGETLWPRDAGQGPVRIALRTA
ncbi:malto-oligosyltrehalose synthase [Pseudooceanicola nanhaiensis]|uniref:Malto-oligosyltrehalose synthase n=1 Tax=Pseudooceanicola nanhaiensis TaxID=375761 RepID=A0A917ST36_9RHOB|nr:malto-oligosyltrehalose synthase [Pseudooceanicola nanhaiensis]GGL97361.1 malto-oligosyltrehalose synthase [Pseudooceanicola nanhaiensis]